MKDQLVWTDTTYRPKRCPFVTLSGGIISVHCPGYTAGGGFSVQLTPDLAQELIGALEDACEEIATAQHEMSVSGSIERKV